MKQATQKSNRDSLATNLSRRLREALLIVTSAIAFFLLMSLFTYHSSDPGWSSTGAATVKQIANSGGRAGAWFADLLLYLFGYMAYAFPFMLAYSAWLFLNAKPDTSFDLNGFFTRIIGFIILILSGCGLSSLQFSNYYLHLPFSAGGILGDVVGPVLTQNFNYMGSTFLLVTLFCVSITLLTGLSWLWLMEYTGRFGIYLATNLKKAAAMFKFRLPQRRMERKEPVVNGLIEEEPLLKIDIKSEPIKKAEAIKKSEPIKIVEPAKINNEPVRLKEEAAKPAPPNPTPPKPTPLVENRPKPIKITSSANVKPENQVTSNKSGSSDNNSDGELPSLTLLDMPEPNSGRGYSSARLEEMSREVEARLGDFGIEVQVVAVHPGPVITRFEMQLAAGIKVSRISTLVKDLARSLSVTSVRIVEIIPGKSVVGLELPNEDRETVRLREILASPQYEQIRSPLALTLGKDIAGHPVIVDLAKMPHLLVAGTTGSGKSVGVNAMLIGLLYKSTPADLRMILVDPKMLELSIYQGIPHLLAPVVTDMKEAANALRWCVAEMERRYRLMSALGVRNLAGFNTKIKDAEKMNTPYPDPIWRGQPGEVAPALHVLPYIVVVIDEYADMMMVVGKKVEQLIARIAQKARAAGIHLILATQRPSVDVVTGLIKANIPTRIAFQVSSKIDSRTVLDQGGAEQLLGNGDMLYLPPGTSVPVRVHGAYVADHEVHKVVEDWQQRGEPEYIPDITRGGSEGGASDGEDGESGAEQDVLYDEAVHIVTLTRRASISSIQRRLKIGYNRAARLIEDMEKAGLVGSMESNGSREVLAPPPPED